jgi:transcriptional regulator with XRE-family HTH domain
MTIHIMKILVLSSERQFFMENEMTTLGERLRQRRTEKNLSLAELARRADLSKGYLHAIENGDTHNPSAEVLFRIANELGTTIADLLGEVILPTTSVEIPKSLKDFAREDNLTEADVEMLAGIQYRGKRPETVADWRFIFESIKRTLR